MDIARGRSAVVTAIAVATIAVLASAAAAQTDTLVITEPQNQTAAPQGGSLRVQGEGCEPNANVVLGIAEAIVGETTAGPDGAFATTITIPVFEQSDVPEEVGEIVLRASCGERTAQVLLVLTDAATEPLPETGRGSARLALLGIALLLAGVATTVARAGPLRRAYLRR